MQILLKRLLEGNEPWAGSGAHYVGISAQRLRDREQEDENGSSRRITANSDPHDEVAGVDGEGQGGFGDRYRDEEETEVEGRSAAV